MEKDMTLEEVVRFINNREGEFVIRIVLDEEVPDGQQEERKCI